MFDYRHKKDASSLVAMSSSPPETPDSFTLQPRSKSLFSESPLLSLSGKTGHRGEDLSLSELSVVSDATPQRFTSSSRPEPPRFSLFGPSQSPRTLSTEDVEDDEGDDEHAEADVSYVTPSENEAYEEEGNQSQPTTPRASEQRYHEGDSIADESRADASADVEESPSIPLRTRQAPDPRQREEELRTTLYQMQSINSVLLEYMETLQAVEVNNQILLQQVNNSHELLNKYTAVLSQTEHTARLLLNRQWQGAEADERYAEGEAERQMREREREERETRERKERLERERIEKEAEEERKLEEQERKAKASEPRGRGGIRARGRGVPVPVRGSTVNSTANTKRERGWDNWSTTTYCATYREQSSRTGNPLSHLGCSGHNYFTIFHIVHLPRNVRLFGIRSSALRQTNLIQIDETHVTFNIPNAGSVGHIVVFLLGTTPFPPGYAATIYFEWSNRPFQLLGMLSNDKPSAVFRVRGIDPDGQQNSGSDVNAILGISIEPIDSVLAQVASLPHHPTTSNAEVARTADPTFIAERIVRHLFTHLSSFEGNLGPQTMIPLGVIQRWYDGLLGKLRAGGAAFLTREDS
ncbi:hypothetical protein FRB94_008817 [Tulasnella sp. JGI-2019a]|nr:hypothetical protein FRB93_012922 [Tulasnella sp. JGI-2019a]KAG9011218.1 hypothetical protein FRB94_008817 [Tulasnella sp. JGI-2019a]